MGCRLNVAIDSGPCHAAAGWPQGEAEVGAAECRRAVACQFGDGPARQASSEVRRHEGSDVGSIEAGRGLSVVGQERMVGSPGEQLPRHELGPYILDPETLK